MTFIKVRGKKGVKIPLESPSPLSSSNQLQPSEPSPRSSLSTGEPCRKKSRRHPTQVLSSLERLPTELLQKVFFECLNVNLPRASPVLSSALSSFHVKFQLLFKAFSSDQGYGLQHSEELIDILHNKQEVANLQSSILRLSWMTAGFLRQCIPVFFERTLMRQFKSYQWQWIDGSPAANLTYATVVNFVQEAYRRARKGARKENLEYLQCTYPVSDRQAIGIKFALVNGVVWLQRTDSHPTSRYLTTDSMEKRWTLLNCLDECHIPEKLLHGPWTDEKCEFLTVLIQARATVDWIDSTSGEVAELGLHDALREHNERAVRLVIFNPVINRTNFIQGLFFDYNPDWTAPSTDAIACREYINHGERLGGIGVTPKMEHLRSAAIDYDCPIELLAIMVRVDNFRIEQKDPALISWAWKKKVEGDKRGEWLLAMFDRV